MGFAKRYVDWSDAMSEWFGWLSQMIVPITIATGVGNVFLRYIGEYLNLKLTSNVVIELQWYLYTLIFLFSFSYILKHGINVRVDFWFAEQPERRKAWIDIVGHFLALLPFCILALYVSWNPVLTSWGHDSRAGTFEGWEDWDGAFAKASTYTSNCRADPECSFNLNTWGKQLPWEMSPDPGGLPRAPIKSMILVGFGTLFLQAIAETIRLIGFLRGDPAFKREEQEAPIRIE